ncbi:HTH-type transcriptional regulator CzcR [Arthrobacter sp. Hiyo8]|nr:HTH-type transcriptional regulator CzcR [Arthrobacter sp. Hiyo8]
MYVCFMIEIAALRALVAVEQQGSVVAASEAMGFSPSAVSQQIKKLEKQSGVTVLERHGRGVLLTDRGMALAEYGRRILGELEELQATLLADPTKPSGVLRLVTFSTACRVLWADAGETRHGPSRCRRIFGRGGLRAWRIRA